MERFRTSRFCENTYWAFELYSYLILNMTFGVEVNVAEVILSHLEARWLRCCEKVSHSWRRVIAHRMLWRKLIERKVRSNPVWRGIAEKRAW
ncbi:unnamed protein product [Anisakis simplex]|uniref:LD08669p (inferred by orthology to a D. melanogaster protein) n=1 Tax=Anisakis simplex TaxID=6269 RepID=A0A0M3JGR4_ANISI|nr:unnamed protein product [Anisakis simplex]